MTATAARRHGQPCLSGSPLPGVCRACHSQLQLAPGNPRWPAGAGAGWQRCRCRRGHGRDAGAGRTDDERPRRRHHGAGVVGERAAGVWPQWQRPSPERRQPRADRASPADAGPWRGLGHHSRRRGWLVRPAGALRHAVAAAAMGAGDRLRARGLSSGRVDRGVLGRGRRDDGAERIGPAAGGVSARWRPPRSRAS